MNWVEFEHYTEAPKGQVKRFKLKPQEFTATISMPIRGYGTNNFFKLGRAKVKVTQIPVNSNIATMGHKLQGMSKNTLIAHS